MIYVLLREGNPDCSCGDEFVALTDSLEIAELWLKTDPEGMYDSVQLNEFPVDGRTKFARAADVILSEPK